MPLPFLKIFVSVDEKNGCRTSNNQIALNTKRQRADAAVESFIERAFEHEDDPLRFMEAEELRAKARAVDPEHVIKVIG